jgi:hypothetical protein
MFLRKLFDFLRTMLCYISEDRRPHNHCCEDFACCIIAIYSEHHANLIYAHFGQNSELRNVRVVSAF